MYINLFEKKYDCDYCCNKHQLPENKALVARNNAAWYYILSFQWFVCKFMYLLWKVFSFVFECAKLAPLSVRNRSDITVLLQTS